ncbi:MAG: ABC transporter ATP-binding protein [Sphaerochaetaceae bacterium]
MEKESEVIVEAKNVKTYFPVAHNQVVKAVDGVSLTLYKGETYGLVGETGCGKSTFGRTLIRLQTPSEGTIKVKGKDISTAPEKKMGDLRKQMQMVFQDPYTSLNPRIRVGDMLMEVLQIHKIGKSKSEKMAIAMEIMEKVGLRTEHFYRYPHEFSGGQRQRIGLARALILNPEIIICDEPVSALDVSIQSQIINLFLDLQETEDLTYLFIAHDISVVKYISNRIGVMYLGHLVEEATAEDLFNHPLHPYTQALLSAVPEANPHRTGKQRIMLKGDLPSPISPPSGCVFRTRCPYSSMLCEDLEPLSIPVGPEKEHTVACHMYLNKYYNKSGVSIEAKGKEVVS